MKSPIFGLCVLLLACESMRDPRLAGTSSALSRLDLGPPFVLTESFATPSGVALDLATGKLLVSDSGNGAIKWAQLSALANTPSWTPFGHVDDGSLPQALYGAQGLVSDAAGNVFVANAGQNRVTLFRHGVANGVDTYTYDPSFVAALPSSAGGVDFAEIVDVALGPDGTLYALDSGNNRVVAAAGGAGATQWKVFFADESWGNPLGLDVGPDGTVYVADTNNSRIAMVSGGHETFFGHYSPNGENDSFNYPSDVAVVPGGSSAGELFVADTNNARVVAWAAGGAHYDFSVAQAPMLSTPVKLAVDATLRLFIVDSTSAAAVAFLGRNVAAPFDAFIRDAADDTGVEPYAGSVLDSPDIVIRRSPDLDLSTLTSLAGVASVQPGVGENNYVYFAVRNRGRTPINDVEARLYFIGADSAYNYPADWEFSGTDDPYAGSQPLGFFQSFVAGQDNTPNNLVTLATVPAQQGTTPGIVLAGPVIWRAPSPLHAMMHTGRYDLALRLTQTYDAVYPTPTGFAQIAANNNIARRQTQPRLRRNGLRVRLAGSSGFAQVWGSTTTGPLQAGRINCREGYDSNCSIVGPQVAYYGVTTAKLVVTLGPGETFAGWSDDCAAAGTNLECDVLLDDNKTVTARINTNDPTYGVALTTVLSDVSSAFTRPSWTVTAPSGYPTQSAGISCASYSEMSGANSSSAKNCVARYPANTRVTLTAKPPLPGNQIVWDGDCTGTGLTCTFTITANSNVRATIQGEPYPCAADNNECTDDFWDMSTHTCQHAVRTGASCGAPDGCNPHTCDASGICRNHPVYCPQNGPGVCDQPGSGWCVDGACRYTPFVCANPPGQIWSCMGDIHAAQCNLHTGLCDYPIKSDGTPCGSQDGLPWCQYQACNNPGVATADGTTNAGTCTLRPNANAPAGETACQKLYCNATATGTYAVNKPDGTACAGGSCCNGTCVDTQTNSQNCGRCSHSCGPQNCHCSINKITHQCTIYVGNNSYCSAGSCTANTCTQLD